MAVLRQDLLRSTFQDQQLNSLNSIDKNTKRSSDSTEDIYDYLESVLPNLLDRMFNNLAISINDRRDYTSALRGFTASINKNTEAQEDVRDTIEEASERARREQEESQREVRRVIERVIDSLANFAAGLGLSVDRFIDDTNSMSTYYNYLLKNTRMSGDVVQEFRSDIVDVVREMNAEYDNKFNAVESVELITTMINNTSIKNLEFFREFADEFLEAEATMNISLSTLAEFSDKFYRRYNFNSEDMDQLLSSISEHTAGTSVDPDKLLEVITGSSNNLITQYLISRKGMDYTSEEFRDAMSFIQENVMGAYTYANEKTLPADELFNIITTALEEGWTSDAARTVQMYAGVGSYEEMYDMFIYDTDGLIDRLATGMSEGYERYYLNSAYRGEYNGQIYLDQDIASDVYTAMHSVAGEMSYDEYLERQEEIAADTDETVDDLYVSMEDKIKNGTSYIADDLAEYQEENAFNLSFIKSIYDLLVGVFGVGASALVASAFGKFFTGSSGGFMGSLSGLFGDSSGNGKGLLGSAGWIGVIIAAVAASVASIKGSIERREGQQAGEAGSLLSYDEVPLGEGQTYGYGVTGYSVDEEGNIIPEKGLIATDNSIDYDYFEQLYADYNQETEDRTGLLAANGDYSFGKYFFTNMGRSLVGTGYWQDDARWYDYIPIISGLGSSISMSMDTSTLFGNKDTNATRAYYADIFMDFLTRAKTDPDLEIAFKFYQDKGLVNVEDILALGTYAANADAITTGLRDTGHVIDLAALTEEGLTNWYHIDDMGWENPYLPVDEEDVPGYAVGTNYVPYDQLAYIHEGEAITPKQYNPAANVNELERLRSQEAEVQEGTLSSLREVSSAVKAIREFLEYWRQDNIDREALAQVKASTSSVNNNLTGLMSGYPVY